MNSNKQLMQQICAELAKGNGGPFIDSLADDFSWTVIGSTDWSGTYSGKQAVIGELLEPLFERFADRYTNTAERASWPRATMWWWSAVAGS